MGLPLGLVFGALAPTIVAGLVVAPLKRMPVGGNAKLLAVGLIENGVWGTDVGAVLPADGAISGR